VQVVFVTVDPERDDAARLHEFLKIFDASFVGGTGTQAEVAAVEKAYGVMAVKEAAQGAGAMGYDVHHSSSVYLIDRQGQLKGLVPFGTSSSDIAHDLQVMLKK
jgi:protein SCO1/2